MHARKAKSTFPVMNSKWSLDAFLSQWKKITFRRERPSLQIARKIHGSNENYENILEHVTEVLENRRMKTIMECIQHKATPSNEDTNFFVTYIFLSLTYTIWQRRPGPALNLTLSEAKEATEKVGKLIIHSASHKTSTHITQLFLWSKEMIQNISSITFKISDQKYPHPPPWSVL